MLYCLILIAQQPAPAPDRTETLIASIIGGLTTILGAWFAYRQGKKKR